METLSLKEWRKYKDILSRCSKKAEEEFIEAITSGKLGGVGFDNIPRDKVIDLAYGLVTKYGEASSAAACVFYDELAVASGALVPAAVPAETASIHDVAKVVNGAAKSHNTEVISSAVGRLVKQAGQDTTLQNAMRDGAQFAWIPSGDTCAFCITLASRGWQTASKKTIKNGHAEHIHANCDCAYGVRFNSSTNYAGYNPQEYKDMYYGDYFRDQFDSEAAFEQFKEQLGFVQDGMPGSSYNTNALRKAFYAKNREKINAQKRSAYAKRKERESDKAEEINVN